MDQRIILNRFHDGSVEVLRPTLQVALMPGQEGRFTIYLENRGDPVRVGFRALGELAELVLFLRDNVLVEREASIPVRVRMAEGEPRLIHGRIEISTRYAASGEGFNLELGATPGDEKEPPGGVTPVDQEYLDASAFAARQAPPSKLAQGRAARRTRGLAGFSLRGVATAQVVTWSLFALLLALLFLTFYIGAFPPLWGGVAASALLVYLLARIAVELLRPDRGKGSAPPMGGGEMGSMQPKRFDRL